MILTHLFQVSVIMITIILAIGSSPAVKLESSNSNLSLLGTTDGKSYYINPVANLNWTEARDYCDISNMKLASIKSRAQMKFLMIASWNATFVGEFWTCGREQATLSAYTWDGESVGTIGNFELGYRDDPPLDGGLTWHTSEALLLLRRRHMKTGVMCEVSNKI